MQHIRDLSAGMLKKLNELPDFDPKRVFTVADQRLNSVYWLTAHIAWAQNNLVLRPIGAPNPELQWLKLFGLGKAPEEGETQGPAWSEVQAGFVRVHELALVHLQQLDPEVLSQPNPLNWNWRGQGDVRTALRHHIAHEGMHTGHLSWLCKLHGVKLI
jgi:hypothetical protein